MKRVKEVVVAVVAAAGAAAEIVRKAAKINKGPLREFRVRAFRRTRPHRRLKAVPLIVAILIGREPVAMMESTIVAIKDGMMAAGATAVVAERIRAETGIETIGMI